jgi:orotate phosphoribosyltransferase-like protein
MDLFQGYSSERMLSILKDRCRYLIERGSTLNNPHIPASYFRDWERITENHAQRLRELVAEALHDKT